MVRNVAVQTVFRIVSAGTISKTICGIEWDIFIRSAGIPNVALLVQPTVHIMKQQHGNYICTMLQ